MRARSATGLVVALLILIPSPARAATDRETKTLDLSPSNEYVSIRDGLPEGKGVPVRPGGKLTVTAPRHVSLADLDLELIAFHGEADVRFTPQELDEEHDAEGHAVTVTIPETIGDVDEAYLAPTEESAPVFTDGWQRLTGEFSYVGLELGRNAPREVTHPLVSRLFLETEELDGRRSLRPGERVRATVPEGDPVLSLLGRIDLHDADVELSPFSDHSSADADKLEARTSSNGLSVTFTVPRSFPAGDSSLGVVATELADPTIEALQWTTRTRVSRDGPSAHVGVARVSATGALVFFLATADRDGGGALRRVEFGRAGDVPLAGDWDGDGHDGIGVYRPSEGAFYLRADAAPHASVVRRVALGAPGEVPVVGRFGDDPTRTTVGVYDPASGRFVLAASNRDGGGDVTTTHLRSPGSLTPLAGDWDGDGEATVGLHRTATGGFDLLGGASPVHLSLGRPGDLPLTGDWNGDGLTEVGVRRQDSPRFVLAGPSSDDGRPQRAFTFGRADDVPFTWTP